MMCRVFAAVGFVLASVAHLSAEPIRFVPPTDPLGNVYTRHSNDGWGDGRGIVFTALQPVALTSVSLFHDLSGLDLFYRVASVSRIEGQVRDGQTVLREGVRHVTTAGLEWIPFAIAPLQLSAGDSYHIEFWFSGVGNQNFFHNNCASFSAANPNTCFGPQIRYPAGPFGNVDGTQAGSSSNFVQPAVMVNVSDTTAPVPEPGTMFLFGSVAVAAGIKRRQARRGGVSSR